MAHSPQSPWQVFESGFESHDGARLFYRAWRPVAAPTQVPSRALVFLHRGHEHSGRIQGLIEPLLGHQDWAFAWDARGHGYSPGERADAPDFETLVKDLDAFVHHLQTQHGVAEHNMVLVANSVGAVIAATWLHDYAPRVRGVVMAAAAFEINLYVPLAQPALRLALKFKPELQVTSYIRPGMLTHCAANAQAYAADPLITRQISARVLLDLADTASRVVTDAQAIDTPVLMLVADTDYVVKRAPQQLFFERLASTLKRWVLLENCRHAVFYEDAVPRQKALQATQVFIAECFARELPARSHQHSADTVGAGARVHQALRQGTLGSAWQNAFYGLQKMLLSRLGFLSDGMRIGMAHGFDSGASLDYVYRNQAGGKFGVGKSMDRAYLNAIGWRGIRQRKAQLQQLLSGLIAQHCTQMPLRILDIAAGGGRYVLETAKRFQDKSLDLTLRDVDSKNLEQARELAQQLGLCGPITYQVRDAFSPDSYGADEAKFDVVIVSGLYELFSDNARVLQSLRGIAQQLKPGGHLVYTGQPWHPQLLLIAKTLTNHLGQAWQMRPRAQVEMDALVTSIGCRKLRSAVGVAGIFTVSVACFEPPFSAPNAGD
jgi:alpha-beta hydrolase superfamily lysophospholipase/2-polyprenyl-3-methyl-5-hydroxy-6-metoxy-1,4-benzoquinol methylase